VPPHTNCMGAPVSGTLYESLAGNNPQAAAAILAGGGPHLTHGQLQELLVGFAQALSDSGIRPGNTVTITDLNTVRSGYLGWLAGKVV
jgi:hypothetical protein